MKTKIAIIQSHPIQHFCPQFASYSKIPGVEVTVFFGSDKGLQTYYDPQFKKYVQWKNIDLGSFENIILGNNNLENELSKHSPDIVIVYGYNNKIQKNAYKWAIRNYKRIFYISDSTSHQKEHPLKRKLKRLMYKRYFSHIDFCLSVGDSNEEIYRGYGIKNHQLIRTPFPIDIETINEKLKIKENIRTLIKSKYNIPDNHLIISSIGKLEEFKRHIDIIHLLKSLEALNIPTTAFIIGSGKCMETLIKAKDSLKSNKVFLTDFIPPSATIDFLCASDIYIHPSSREAHSLSISEAIYVGCPVILTDNCGSYGPTDDVQPGKNGFVYKTGEVDMLCKLVVNLKMNPQILKNFSNESTRIGQNNQKLAHGAALQVALNIIKTR